MKKGLVVILSGACSVGKHDLTNRLLNDPDLDLVYSVSLTTRPKKEKEVDGKDYYMNGYGKMAKNTWSGAYYLGADGVMMTNAFTKDNYYVGNDGAYYRSRWFKHKGKDYYVDGNGHVVKNAWIGSYYLGEDGAMLTNTFTPDGYYVGSDGA